MTPRIRIGGFSFCAAAWLGVSSCGIADVAVESVRFDLRILGESVYEAYARDGAWPSKIEDLEGTAYLRLPHRREGLREGVYVVVWHPDLDPEPERNANRILAYHNAGLLAKGREIWVCRGNLETALEDAAAARSLGP